MTRSGTPDAAPGGAPSGGQSGPLFHRSEGSRPCRRLWPCPRGQVVREPASRERTTDRIRVADSGTSTPGTSAPKTVRGPRLGRLTPAQSTGTVHQQAEVAFGGEDFGARGQRGGDQAGVRGPGGFRRHPGGRDRGQPGEGRAGQFHVGVQPVQRAGPRPGAPPPRAGRRPREPGAARCSRCSGRSSRGRTRHGPGSRDSPWVHCAARWRHRPWHIGVHRTSGPLGGAGGSGPGLRSTGPAVAQFRGTAQPSGPHASAAPSSISLSGERSPHAWFSAWVNTSAGWAPETP
jgi:hypothetical protein